MNSIPLSLYIHYPWCQARCHYCDFNAHTSPPVRAEKQYTEAMLKQFKVINELRSDWGDERKKLQSIFIGGGTPSLISGDWIEFLLSEVERVFDINHAEITIEANPESVTEAWLKQCRRAKINRISIGIQSFNPNQLKKLSRIHTANQAQKAINEALNYFDNLNLDLMYGLIEQSETEALQDLNTALSFPITHLSYYELTIEPNTYFHHFPPKQSSEQKRMKMQKNAIEILKSHQFNQYEVSAYAKTGDTQHQSRHNLNYWQFGDYLAIGAGGAAKLSFNETNTETSLNYFRYSAPKKPEQYINWALNLKSSTEIEFQSADWQERVFEFFLNTSRLTSGFNSDLFHQRLGVKIQVIENELKELIAKELLLPMDFSKTSFWIQPSEKGRQYLNEIPKYFL